MPLSPEVDSNAYVSSIVQVDSGVGFETWQRERPLGTLNVHWSERGAVRMHVVGRGAGDFARPVIRRYEAAVRDAGRVLILFDLSRMHNYDTALRQDLTDWCLPRRSLVSAIHLHTESAVVTMGARVASLLLGGMIEIHAKRDTFDAIVRQAGLSAVAAR
jgi:hypothetical protein